MASAVSCAVGAVQCHHVMRHDSCHSCHHPQADDPLATFMDYCTYGHMIDNVVLIVTGTLHERDVQVMWPVVICMVALIFTCMQHANCPDGITLQVRLVCMVWVAFQGLCCQDLASSYHTAPPQALLCWLLTFSPSFRSLVL